MLSRARLLLLLGLCGIAAGQTPATPPDIDPNSLSRFPIVQRSEMKTDADRAAYDYVVGTEPRATPLRGPGGLSLQTRPMKPAWHPKPAGPARSEHECPVQIRAAPLS